MAGCSTSLVSVAIGSASTVWIGEEIGSLFPQPVRTPTAIKIAASTFFFMNASFHLFVLSGLSTGTLKYIVSLKSYVCPPKILKIFLRFYFAKNDIWQLYADVIFAFYNYYLLFFYSPDIYSLYKIFLAEWINDHKRQNCYDDCCIFYCIFRSSFYRRRQITSHDQCPQFHLEVI